MESVFESLIV